MSASSSARPTLPPALGWLGRPVAGAHPMDWLSLATLALASLVMVATASDYGLTYDEDPHVRYGERVLRFYASGLRETSWLAKSSYGAGFDLLAALVRRVSPWDAFVTNHAVCVFVAQLGLLGTWRLGRLTSGPLGGWLSLAFLILVPVYYGHQFNNPKDIPFAAGYVWGLYFTARLLASARLAGTPHGAPPGWRYWVGLCVALGLGLSVRVGGVLVLAYLFFFLGLLALDRLRLEGRCGVRPLGPLAGRALGASLGAWAIMALFWPRALLSPVTGPAQSLAHVSNFTSYDSPSLLHGKVVSSNHLPWDYLPSYFALQIPELVMVSALSMLVVIAAAAVRGLRRRAALPLEPALLAVAVLAPPAYVILRGSTLYNGLRHFLFVIPPLCVLAAATWSRALPWLWQRRPVLGLVGGLIVAAHLVDQLFVSARLHPHQHVYFNRIAGGVRSAVGRYETEYYGSVYRELHRELARHVWQNRREGYLDSVFRVSGCGSYRFFAENLPLNFEYRSMRHASKSDFYATYVRDGCLRRFRDRKLLAAVQREGAILGVARDLKAKKTKRKRRDGARRRPRKGAPAQ